MAAFPAAMAATDAAEEPEATPPYRMAYRTAEELRAALNALEGDDEVSACACGGPQPCDCQSEAEPEAELRLLR